MAVLAWKGSCMGGIQRCPPLNPDSQKQACTGKLHTGCRCVQVAWMSGCQAPTSALCILDPCQLRVVSQQLQRRRGLARLEQRVHALAPLAAGRQHMDTNNRAS